MTIRAICGVSLLAFFSLIWISTMSNSDTGAEAIERTGGIRLVESLSELDVFITGRHYFRVERDGEMCIVRAGRLVVLPLGYLGLRTSSGDVPFLPHLYIPDDAKGFAVDPLGEVTYRYGQDNRLTMAGQLSCIGLNAARLMPCPIDVAVVPDGDLAEGEFGPESGVFIVSGWAPSNR